MALLNATLRNDYLRISILNGHPDAASLNEMQSEFVQLLQSADTSEVIIVDLPIVARLESSLISMLLTWQRIAALAGRKFRMNGVSGLVSQILEEMAQPRSVTVSGPHRWSSRQPAFA